MIFYLICDFKIILYANHTYDYIRAQNNDQSQVIVRPTLAYDRAVQFGRTNLLYISNGEANDSL